MEEKFKIHTNTTHKKKHEETLSVTETQQKSETIEQEITSSMVVYVASSDRCVEKVCTVREHVVSFNWAFLKTGVSRTAEWHSNLWGENSM